MKNENVFEQINNSYFQFEIDLHKRDAVIFKLNFDLHSIFDECNLKNEIMSHISRISNLREFSFIAIHQRGTFTTSNQFVDIDFERVNNVSIETMRDDEFSYIRINARVNVNDIDEIVQLNVRKCAIDILKCVVQFLLNLSLNESIIVIDVSTTIFEKSI